MASATQIPGPTFTLTTASDGVTYSLGDPTPDTPTGALSLDFVPDGSWSGSITIVTAPKGPDAWTAEVPFVASPYRKLYLNGAVGDGTLVSTAITGRSAVIVPAPGRIVGIDVTDASAGTCTVYINQTTGCPAI